MRYAPCTMLFSKQWGGTILKIAIMWGFWYTEAGFREVIETDAREFKIGVENELRKEDHFREVIERLKEDSIKKGKKKYFITIA